MKRFFALVFFTIVPLFCVACSPNQQIEELTNEKAKQKIDSGDITVLDVRTEEEHAAGHIQKSISIPLGDLEDRLDELDKNGAYMVVSQTGSESSQAAAVLVNNGFTEVYQLKSGMSAWSYPLEK
ncbi:rhodanese-like domain-containing protein [Bacillus sp. SG-1]|uniref:rhodanese-like domain-containing protein n=1 Tax=Bacillus sp. SG-1 TaxID=161544 RepID=UPI00015444A8|nr:rhodanese-like domain-containing protein [Bacillus sp. SG-1]EDL65782.1 YrkF [Bacillus sp. SG-1]